MRKHLVMTVSGADRTGIVEHVTGVVLNYDSNVEASRMSRLGGEFAILMLVSVPEAKSESLREAVRNLREQNFKVTTHLTDSDASAKFSDWIPYDVTVTGADHEGIIHQITRLLSERKVNIEAMDTEVIKAPMSGTPLFKMTALVLTPPDLNIAQWRQSLTVVGDEVGVDIEIEPHVI